MDEHEIRAVRQRTRRYWLEDGLPELTVGVLFLYLGGLMLLPHELRRTPVGLALNLGWIALGLSSFRIMKWLKARTTFPRTGYAVPARIGRGSDWRPALLMGGLVLVTGLLSSLLGGTRWEHVEPLLTPLASAVGCVGVAVWLGVPRVALVGLTGLLGAGAFFWAGAGGDALLAGFCAVIGSSALISGALAFSAFRRRTQAPPEA